MPGHNKSPSEDGQISSATSDGMCCAYIYIESTEFLPIYSTYKCGMCAILGLQNYGIHIPISIVPIHVYVCRCTQTPLQHHPLGRVPPHLMLFINIAHIENNLFMCNKPNHTQRYTTFARTSTATRARIYITSYVEHVSNFPKTISVSRNLVSSRQTVVIREQKLYICVCVAYNVSDMKDQRHCFYV